MQGFGGPDININQKDNLNNTMNITCVDKLEQNNSDIVEISMDVSSIGKIIADEKISK